MTDSRRGPDPNAEITATITLTIQQWDEVITVLTTRPMRFTTLEPIIHAVTQAAKLWEQEGTKQ